MTDFVDPDAVVTTQKGFVDPDAPNTEASTGSKIEQSHKSALLSTEATPEYMRAIGLLARHGINALTGLGQVVADVPFRVANLAGANVELPSEAQQHLMTKLGIPEPKTPIERYAGAIATGMGGVATGVGLGNILARGGNAVASEIGNLLQQAPGMQVASGATGGGAAQFSAEHGANPIVQTVAGMAGAMVPFSGNLAAQGVKRAIRGNDPAEMQGAIRAFESQGLQPTVGQASDTTIAKGLEGTLPKIPGGAEPLIQNAQNQAQDMGERVNFLANGLMKDATPMIAGRRIQTGIQNFVDTFKDRQKALYNVLDNWIKPQDAVDVNATKSALASMNSDIPGAPALSEFFKNKKIQSIESALLSDTEQPPTIGSLGSRLGLTDGQKININDQAFTNLEQQFQQGTLPYEAVKKLRTLVGDQLSNSSLLDQVPRNKWKALYASLSNDLEGAAAEKGPEATQAFSRANWFSRAGYGRIENALDNISGRDTVEGIYKAATGDVKDGGSTITSVMRSLQPDERKMLTAAFTKRLGWTGADQDAAGNYFSVPKFLTDWKKIDPKAKQAIYGDHAGTMGSDLNLISAIGDRITRASKVGANPSGTAQGVLNAGGLITAASAAVTGHLGTAAMILGGMKGAQLSSRLMTNPDFVHWLAKATTASPAMLPSQLNALSQVAAHSNDPAMKRDIQIYQQGLQ